MALRFIDSFDHYRTAQLLDKWTDGFLLTAIKITQGVGRCGTNALQVGLSLTVSVHKGIAFASTTTVVGFAMHIIQSPTFAAPITVCELGTAFGGHLVLSWALDGSLLVYRRDIPLVLLGQTVPDVVKGGNYYYIEIKSLISETVGTVEIRVNGVVRLTLTGIDTFGVAGGVATPTRITFYGAQNFDYYIDDLYALDSTGLTNTTFLGDVHVEYLRPDAPGAYQEWTLVGSPTHWQAVNDGDTPDDDTTYLSSVTAGQRDTQNYLPTGLPSGSIFGLQIGLYTRKTDSGFRTVRPLIRSGGVDALGVAQAPSFPSYTYLIELFETNPTTGVAWIIATVNAGEFGLQVGT